MHRLSAAYENLCSGLVLWQGLCRNRPFCVESLRAQDISAERNVGFGLASLMGEN